MTEPGFDIQLAHHPQQTIDRRRPHPLTRTIGRTKNTNDAIAPALTPQQLVDAEQEFKHPGHRAWPTARLGLLAKPMANRSASSAFKRSRIVSATSMLAQGISACSIPGKRRRKQPPEPMINPSLSIDPVSVSTAGRHQPIR